MNRIGTVYLRVADLEKQVRFYENVIGLQVHQRQGNTVTLGVDQENLLALIHTPAGEAIRGGNGLYHFALLLPSRTQLAQSLQHLLLTQTPLQGLSDHIVSEAIYLADPEGNGIEIYADRPREQWHRNGQLQMATLPLNTADLMAEIHDTGAGTFRLPSETIMGHIHLHVPNLAAAATYVQNDLGMALMFNIPSAAFLAYDAYHHHLGVNTWAGRVEWSPNALGLDHFTILNQDQQWLDCDLRMITSQTVTER